VKGGQKGIRGIPRRSESQKGRREKAKLYLARCKEGDHDYTKMNKEWGIGKTLHSGAYCHQCGEVDHCVAGVTGVKTPHGRNLPIAKPKHLTRGLLGTRGVDFNGNVEKERNAKSLETEGDA